MRTRWKLRLLAALLLALPLLAGRPDAARAQVVASIKPVHSLVAAVMAGVGTPELIVRGSASPHTYSLRPSDATRLAAARVIFWIGPAFEAFLVRPLATLSPSATVVTLSAAPGVTVLPARHGGVWGEHADEHGADDDGADETRDGHLWLDPRNAAVMVGAIAEALAAADPAHAAAYAANAAAARRDIAGLDAELAARLAPVRGVGFIVFHDAYQYLERRYGLAALGAVTVSPEAKPGARRVAELRDRIRASGARCVFAEPQFEPALVRILVAETGARSGTLDPEGAAIPEGPGLYATLMRGLADSLVRCLG
jgi:zinc transport system substrate-binding protein